jgi:type I restriction enzyme S subunit
LSPVTYGIVQPGKFDQNGVLLIRGQDYISGWATEPEFFRVSENLHKQFIRSKTTKGDILICIVGATYGAVTVVPDWIEEANITQTTARIRCDKNTFSSSFLEYYLKSDFGKYFINKYVKGSAQPGLNLGDVDKFIIKFPKDIQEQNLIGSRLITIDNQINSEVEYLHKQQQIKAGLMNDLLSGRKKVIIKKELEPQTGN